MTNQIDRALNRNLRASHHHNWAYFSDGTRLCCDCGKQETRKEPVFTPTKEWMARAMANITHAALSDWGEDHGHTRTK